MWWNSTKRQHWPLARFILVAIKLVESARILKKELCCIHVGGDDRRGALTTGHLGNLDDWKA